MTAEHPDGMCWLKLPYDVVRQRRRALMCRYHPKLSLRRSTAVLLACLVIGWTFATILLNVPVARAQPDPRFPVPNPNVTADTSSSAYMHGWMNAQHLFAVARNEGWTVRGWVAALRGPHSMCVDNAQYAYIDAQPLSGDGPLVNYDVDQDYQGCMKAVHLQLETN